jgi:CBS domain-containing protein
MTTLGKIKARDLMQKEVITLRAGATVQEAIETFEEYHISGAPVVDESGRLVGVLSARDITRTEHVRGGRIETMRTQYYLANPLEEEGESLWVEEDLLGKEDYSPQVLGNETVGDWMKTEVVSVAPDASLKKLCRLMTEESIHRVLIVENGSVVGLVSTFDVVRHLAESL